MKNISTFLVVAFVLGLSAVASADRVCFYQDINYAGPSFCVTAGASDTLLQNSGWGRRISSVTIEGNAVVELFSSGSFGGAVAKLNVSNPDLRSKSFNDVAESYRTSVPAGRICFWENINYSGNVLCMNPGTEIRDLTPSGWNDKISSIQVFGDASAYLWEDSMFSGYKLWLKNSVSNLNSAPGWNDRISSIRTVHANGQ